MTEARDKALQGILEVWSAVEPALKEQVIYSLNEYQHSLIAKVKNCSFFDALHLQQRVVANLQAYSTAIALLAMLGQITVQPCSCEVCRSFDQALADAAATAQKQEP